MIRTVKIPTSVSRMGCTPGGDCCAECAAETGPPIGPAAIHTHGIPSGRNTSLKAALGDTQCDADGNCYTNGVLTAAPLTTGPGCPPGVANCATPNNSTLLYLGAGLALVLLLEVTSRRR